MATQNIIQYLETSQYNALPNPGGLVPVGAEAMNRRQVETFIAGAAIAANDLVCLDLSKTDNGEKAITIIKADGAVVAKRCVVGFALNAATNAGDSVDVTIAGLHIDANVLTGVAQGTGLSTSGTAGRSDAYVAGDTVPVIGFALETAAANKAPVFVIKQF
tara:strand:- start:8192 stop:8674 length:483 start_codon:yes stop_codon:yes gene_type:complete